MINEKTEIIFTPKDQADSKNAIIEIRAGTGGLETVFLHLIYTKCMKKFAKKWIIEIVSISKSDAGGLKEVIAIIKGKNIYSLLKYESGVYRVQKYQILKHKVEFIHQRQQWLFYQKQRI